MQIRLIFPYQILNRSKWKVFLFWAQVISELLKTKGYKGRDSILLYELEKHHFQVFLGFKKQFDFFLNYTYD